MRALLLAALLCALLPSRVFATFSIVAVDIEERHVGGAGASCVGELVSVSQIYGSVPGRGAIHVQALLGAEYRMVEALRRLQTDEDPSIIIGALTDRTFDPLRARRQYGVVDLLGRSAGFSGEENGTVSGDLQAGATPFTYSVQGNLLTGEDVLQEMSSAFNSSACDLPERLLAALEAGGTGRGDRRCEAFADGAFLQVDREGEPAASYLSLRVDNHPAPIEELRRQFDAWRLEHPCVAAPMDGGDGGDATVEPSSVSEGGCRCSASTSYDAFSCALLLLFVCRSRRVA